MKISQPFKGYIDFCTYEIHDPNTDFKVYTLEHVHKDGWELVGPMYGAHSYGNGSIYVMRSWVSPDLAKSLDEVSQHKPDVH